MALPDQTEGKDVREPSTPGDSQPLTDPALKALQSEIGDLRTKLENSEKRWQSDKDKRLPKIEGKVDDLQKTIEDILKRAGSDANPGEIAKQIKLERLLATLDGEEVPTTARVDTPKSGQATEAERIAKELNLDVNDKDIAAAIASNDLVGLTRTAISKHNQPSISDAPPPGGSPPPKPDLSAAYQKELQQLRDSRMSNPITVSELKEKYRKLGLEVW